MKNKNTDKNYQKYIVKLCFSNKDIYCIWGCDTSNPNEPDVFLINEDKNIIGFKYFNSIKEKLALYKSNFFDEKLFNDWIKGGETLKLNSSFDCVLLKNFTKKMLLNETQSIELLNILNLLQDYYLQVNQSRRFDKLLILKNYLYDNFFWISSDSNDEMVRFENLDIFSIRQELLNLYNDFRNRILIID